MEVWVKRVNTVGIRRKLWTLVRFILIVGISYLILFPVLGRLSSSLMSRGDMWDKTVVWIPRNPTLHNYRLAFEGMKYPYALFNSIRLSLMVSLFQLLSCTLIGYGFARFQFRGNSFFFGLVIFSLVVPPEMISIPTYLNFRYFNFYGILGEPFNLIGSYWPFVLTSLTGTGLRNGLFIYIMRQFFKGMPVELEEAAYVDGAGPLKTFFRVMLPGAIPALIIVFLFSFVWQWNDNYLTSLFLSGEEVLPEMLRRMPRRVLGQYYSHAPEENSLLNNAGSIMVIIPIIVLYAALQRYFVESVERTGLGSF